MADQKRWFKVWTSIVSDDDFDPTRDGGLIAVGRFCLLGAYTALHGNHGVVEIRKAALLRLTHAQNLDELSVTPTLQNVKFEEMQNPSQKITVTWAKWVKYQEDFTQAERQKKSRSKRREEERREEEIRKRGDSKRFIDWFFERYQKQFGKKYLVSGGKDGEIVKRLLGTFNFQELIILAEKFFTSSDPYIAKAGFSIGVFSSQINKLNSTNDPSIVTDLRTPTERLAARKAEE